MTKVAVIGCGVVGAAIAYELSKIEGLSLTLIDQNTPASGATSAALGIMMGIISQKFKGRAWQLRQTSLQRYDSLIPELENLTGITIPYNQQGIVMLSSELEEIEKWHKLAQKRQEQGFNLEIWDKDQIKHRCPQIDLDTNQIIAALYSPRDRQVNPTILTQALVAGAAKNGVNCQFGVTVTELISNSSNSCQEIVTDHNSIPVDWVVVSAGIGTTPLIKSLEIRPVLGQALHLKLNQTLGNPTFQPIITGDDVHIVPLGKGEYWVGATVEFPNQDNEIIADPKQLIEVKQKAIAFCPELATGEIIRTWSGLRPRPEGKAAPIIEPLSGYQNVLLATGHYRNGILLAPATAQAIALGIKNTYKT